MEYRSGIRSPILFKFTARHWMDAFFSSGSLKLGTIRGYHDTVAYAATQGDPREGEVTHVRRYPKGHVHTADQADPMLAGVLTSEPG